MRPTLVQQISRAAKLLRKRKRAKNIATQERLSHQFDHLDFVCGNRNAPFVQFIEGFTAYAGLSVPAFKDSLEALRRAQLNKTEREEHLGIRPSAPVDHERAVRIMEKVYALEMNPASVENDGKIAAAIDYFKRADGDSGSTETQSGILTVKILALEKHVKANTKDYGAARALMQMIQARQRLLRYLRKGKDHDKYFKVINALGLEDHAILNECKVKLVEKKHGYSY